MPDTLDADRLASQLHGKVVRPEDGDYDEARALYNAMIDKRPALIARVNMRDVPLERDTVRP